MKFLGRRNRFSGNSDGLARGRCRAQESTRFLRRFNEKKLILSPIMAYGTLAITTDARVASLARSKVSPRRPARPKTRCYVRVESTI